MIPRLRHLADRLGAWSPGWRARNAIHRARARAARIIDPDVDRYIAARERETSAARVERDNAIRRMDDLAIRILSATLAIGRVGNVELDRRELPGAAHDTYYPGPQVTELLETARGALFEAEDVARYATLARRQAAQTAGPDPALVVNTLRGTIERALLWLNPDEGDQVTPYDLAHVREMLRDALNAA